MLSLLHRSTFKAFLIRELLTGGRQKKKKKKKDKEKTLPTCQGSQMVIEYKRGVRLLLSRSVKMNFEEKFARVIARRRAGSYSEKEKG